MLNPEGLPLRAQEGDFNLDIREIGFVEPPVPFVSTPLNLMTRREFLGRMAGTTAGLFLTSQFDLRGLLSPFAPPPHEGPKTHNGDLERFLEGRVPWSFQVDSLPGTRMCISDDLERAGVLSTTPSLVGTLGQLNFGTIFDSPTKLRGGLPLLVPNSLNVHTDPMDLARLLSGVLVPKIVFGQDVAKERQFSMREVIQLSGVLYGWIMPYLDTYAPNEATAGVVLISRPSDAMYEYYVSGGGDRNGLTRLGPVDTGDDAFSFFREGSKMVPSGREDGKLNLRRIYLLKSPDEELRAQISSGRFLLSSAWSKYFYNSVWETAHELLHLVVTSDYSFPPFDTHAFVRSLSLACVLDYMKGGKSGDWNRGNLKNELWYSPELEVLRRHRGFYKELFTIMRQEGGLGRTAFDEQSVLSAAERVFELNQLGNFQEFWKNTTAMYNSYN